MTNQGMVVNVLLRQGKIESDDPHLQGCGLRMKVEVPDEYPDDFPEELVGMDAVNYLRELTLEEAVRRWNRRSDQ